MGTGTCFDNYTTCRILLDIMKNNPNESYYGIQQLARIYYHIDFTLSQAAINLLKNENFIIINQDKSKPAFILCEKAFTSNSNAETKTPKTYPICLACGSQVNPVGITKRIATYCPHCHCYLPYIIFKGD